MNATVRTIAVGVFDNRPDAQRAIQALRAAGFQENHIGVIAPGDEEIRTGEEAQLGDEEDSKAGSGAVTGAAAGLGVGGLWGLGVVAGMLPAIGPVIAGGAFAAVLASAAAGAAAGGLIGALIGMGIPEDEAEYYRSEVERGNILLTVQAGDRYQEAQEVLYDFGAHNVHRRDTGERADTDRPGLARTGRENEREIELREERLRAVPETRTGEVDIRKEVHTERQHVDVPIEKEEVVIERRPTRTHEARGPVGKTEEIRVPVKEQSARVEKETVSKGDVRIGKRTFQDTERVAGDVRKEELEIERKGKARVEERR